MDGFLPGGGGAVVERSLSSSSWVTKLTLGHSQPPPAFCVNQIELLFLIRCHRKASPRQKCAVVPLWTCPVMVERGTQSWTRKTENLYPALYGL